MGMGKVAGWGGLRDGGEYIPVPYVSRGKWGLRRGWLADFLGTGKGKQIAYELRDWSGRDVDCGACIAGGYGGWIGVLGWG